LIASRSVITLKLLDKLTDLGSVKGESVRPIPGCDSRSANGQDCGLVQALFVSLLDLSKLYFESTFGHDSMVAPRTCDLLSIIDKSSSIPFVTSGTGD
jgi:hypothetical protein